MLQTFLKIIKNMNQDNIIILKLVYESLKRGKKKFEK